MKHIFLYATLYILFAGCNNTHTHTLKTADGTELKVELPDNIELATDSVHFTEKLIMNTIHWKLTGTEPFWSIFIHGDSVKYITPENQIKGEQFIIASLLTEQDAADETVVYEYTLNDPAASRITIRKEVCSDGMSDKQYAYAATFDYGKLQLKGCAEKK